MAPTIPCRGFILSLLMMGSMLCLNAQDPISWLEAYTGSMQIGNDSYQYQFTSVDGSDCKLKFEEQHTNKKGAITVHSWIFYLSDLDPSALSFKAKGKAINLLMKVQRSQKFVSYYKGEELEKYTDEIALVLDEVAMARSFIETIKERLPDCQESQLVWEQPRQALNWLVDHVGHSTQNGSEWDQHFSPGNRDYMVDFEVNSVNSKGETQSTTTTFDLSDINPEAIDLKISGKSLWVEVPVKENKKYLEQKSPAGSQFTNKFQIYADEMEVAREIVHALYYLVSHTTPERPSWNSYTSSMEFFKNNLEELALGEKLYSYSLQFDPSPSGLVHLVAKQSEMEGSSETLEYKFYMADLMNEANIEVSRNSITLKLNTLDKLAYIMEVKEGKTSDYTSSLAIYISNLDLARDLKNALQFAVDTSDQSIIEFADNSEIKSWFSENIGGIELGEQAVSQLISVREDAENQLTVDIEAKTADGESRAGKYILYPEDIDLEKLAIKVSGKKLYVLLQTDKGKYVKRLENDQVQNFVSSTEVLFYDPLVAKNFMSAIRTLHINSLVEDRSGMPVEEAMAFLLESVQNVSIPGKQFEQRLEFSEEDKCKVTFTRVETDSKGIGTEYRYEFAVSDLHAPSSKYTIKGASVIINLLTEGGEKLIKPYKHSEAGNFVDDFSIYADDVLQAKKILGAFAALSGACK